MSDDSAHFFFLFALTSSVGVCKEPREDEVVTRECVERTNVNKS